MMDPSQLSIADIGFRGGIGRHEVPKLLASPVQPDCRVEAVDRLVGIGADDMGAEEAVRVLLDQDREGCCVLFDASGRIP